MARREIYETQSRLQMITAELSTPETPKYWRPDSVVESNGCLVAKYGQFELQANLAGQERSALEEAMRQALWQAAYAHLTRPICV
jgi:hypothetical protein